MPRKPKAKDGLTAGQRVALYEAQLEEKRKNMLGETQEKQDLAKGENAEEKPGVPQRARELQKPQYATVKVDFSLKTGEIKPLHGMCNGPASYGADITSLFREIGVPYVRFDCTDTAVSAYAVDISRIFKNADADPTDPESYDFETTDRYVEAAYLSGARVIFRLGESIDLIGKTKRKLPQNLETLARVCVNIIRHYNEGWASGYTFEIEYFEVWNCSGDKGTDEFELYRSLANSLKLYDEDLKIGGMSFAGSDSNAREFLRYCKKNRVPLDFVSVDCFAGEVEKVGRELEELNMLIKNLGFDSVELIIGKWSFCDSEIVGNSSFKSIIGGRDAAPKKALLESQRGIKGAAYSAALLLRLLSVPDIKTACFFDAQPMISSFCAIADSFGEPLKPYYSFKAYGDLYRAKNSVFAESVQTEDMAHTGIYAAAAMSDNGEGVIMLASFKGCGVIDLRLDGISDSVCSADIYMLDGVKNMALADSVPVSGMKKRILLNISEYGVVIIKLY